MINALLRALLMAGLLAMPSLLLPGIGSDGAQIALFTALLAAIFTFAEYASQTPSLLEFRDAKPFNRMRFAMAALIIGLLTALVYGVTEASRVATLAQAAAGTLGALLDQPFSPVRRMLLAMPDPQVQQLDA
jgi:hypothetical protein